MSSFEIHLKKYKIFFNDAGIEANSEPTRIGAYFESAFHLIEAVCAKNKIHINKHQMLRAVLEENKNLFADKTEDVWRAFQEIENQIRPGQSYGGAIDGAALRKTKELFKKIREVCEYILKDIV